MRRGRNKLWLAAVAGVLWLGPLRGSLAQQAAGPDGPPVSSAPAGGAAPSLQQQQQLVNEHVGKLQLQMLKLVRLLADREPDKAQRLRDALDRHGEGEVERKLAAAARLLESAQLSDADGVQKSVIGELEAMLELLNDAGNTLERKRAERERFLALQRQVQKLMDQQVQELQRTRVAKSAAEAMQALSERAAALEQLAEEQRRLREEPSSAQNAAEIGDVARRQTELAERAEQAQDQLGNADPTRKDRAVQQAMQSAARSVEQAAQSMRDAAQQLQRPESTREPREDGGSEDPKPGQASSSEPSPAAAAAQREAEESLRRAVRRLRDESRRLEKSAGLRERAREQRALEQQAGRVEDQMRGGGQGSSQQSQQRMSQARQHMQRAADRLGEQDAPAGQEQQQQALQELQETLNELSDALRQTREEEIEETLGALEARFKAIVARQEQLREGLAPFSSRVELTRTDELALAEMAEGQNTVTVDTVAIQQLLVAEGTTVILPELLANVIADMRRAAQRIEGKDASGATLQLMDDILSALREILSAIEQRREEMSAQSPEGQPQGTPQSAALLPSSAELKLLKAAQLRINTATAELAKNAAPAAAARVHDLAQQQQRLTELARRMHEKR